MKIKIIETQKVAGEVFSAGSICEVSEGQAKTWVDSGIAERVEPATPPRKRKEVGK